MNPKTAIEIGESIGEVIIPQDVSEMRGGTFMRGKISHTKSATLYGEPAKVCCPERERSQMESTLGQLL